MRLNVYKWKGCKGVKGIIKLKKALLYRNNQIKDFVYLFAAHLEPNANFPALTICSFIYSCMFFIEVPSNTGILEMGGSVCE